MAVVRGRQWARWLALVAVAVAIVFLPACLDRQTVDDRQQLAEVALGTPWPWLRQDQTSMNPPLPYRTAFLSPLEHPTAVAWWALGADVIVVVVVIAALWRLGTALLRRSSRGGAPA